MPSLAEYNRTFFYNLKRYGLSLTKEEVRQMAITLLIVAFVWSFNKWGKTTFDPVDGIKNFLLGALFAAVAMVFNQALPRLIAVHYGYDPDYEYGMMGLMISLIVTFASRGILIFFLPGVISVRHLAASRLGEFRYYTNDWEWCKAVMTAPLGNLLLASVLGFFKDNPLVYQFMVMNIMFACYSIFPIPGNMGLPLFYPHIWVWTFTTFFTIVTSLILLFLHPLIALVVGLLAGLFAMYYHFVKIDNMLKYE